MNFNLHAYEMMDKYNGVMNGSGMDITILLRIYLNINMGRIFRPYGPYEQFSYLYANNFVAKKNNSQLR